MDLKLISQQVKTIVSDIQKEAGLKEGHILVIGCSTSEVLGKHIGKAGSKEVAEALFEGIREVQLEHGFSLAFQCCEHLNRAIVIERETMERFHLEEVSVVPVPAAGGSMASHAFNRFTSPAVVEHIQAHAGVDIGDTFIGMHLRHVAVPVRPSLRQIGEAHVTAARTRPKLIGGARAVYDRNIANQSCK